MSITTIGSGNNHLLLRVSQDAYLGAAQYNVSVDGVPVDGTQTADALHGAGQDDQLIVLGNFALGPHTVTVDFLNDAYDGSAATDRNLYVGRITADGALVPDSTAALFSSGPHDFAFTESGPPAPITNTIGSGPDTLVLKVSQNFYLENAQYTVSVDGVQIDGTQFAHAQHTTGQDDTLTVHGSFAPGAHAVTVNFLNDTSDGTFYTDRNLYVDGITINGQAVPGGSADLLGPGPHDFAFTEAPTSVDNTIGSGADALVLKLSQDFYLGDAQYTVSVDGVQVDGTQTAGAHHGIGQDTLTVKGDWGPGAHAVAVNFLNDAWGGSPDTDRNLYVEGVSYNGVSQPGGTATLFTDGPQGFGFTDTGTPVPVNHSFGSGPDALVLQISQNFYLENAQYSVSVDGVPVDGTLSASAYKTAGQDDTVTINGVFSPGQHTVTVNFLNDLWNGTFETDRNLYVDGITLNGTALADGSAALLAPGPHDFIFSA